MEMLPLQVMQPEKEKKRQCSKRNVWITDRWCRYGANNYLFVLAAYQCNNPVISDKQVELVQTEATYPCVGTLGSFKQQFSLDVCLYCTDSSANTGVKREWSWSHFNMRDFALFTLKRPHFGTTVNCVWSALTCWHSLSTSNRSYVCCLSKDYFILSVTTSAS